jgi:hypothetical protein
LFDIAQYTRAYEAALTQMWETWANGHDPQGVAVPAAPPSRTLAAAEPSIKRRAYSACPLCESRDMSAVIGADCSRHPIFLAEDGSEAVHPFAVLSMGANAQLQMRAAHAFAENFKAPAFEHRREDFACARKLKIGL